MSMADVTSILLALVAGVMAGANIVVITAKLLHHEEVVQAVRQVASHVTWLFRIGASETGTERNAYRRS